MSGGDTAPAMVFHAPYPVAESGGTGSGVRPIRMRQAFRDAGYEVLEITGTGAQRRERLRDLRRRLDTGLRVEFCYGENSTMPTVLTESHHLPTHPLVDVQVLRLMRRHGIPAGMFYRDIYWRFPEYTERVNPVIAAGTRTLYHAELRAYRRWLGRMYLPSLRLADYVPHLCKDRARALPPGGAVVDQPRVPGPFTLLYVGNISPYYRMQELLRAAADVPDLHVILCTTEDAWAAVRGEYTSLLTDRVEVVHRSGEGLTELFARADLCSLVVEPSEYRDFAAPVKLFEYVGHGKPVLASAGTHAASLVEADGLGWAVPYAAAELTALLARLSRDPAEVERASAHVRAAREDHTWAARARTVADDLAGLDRRPAPVS